MRILLKTSLALLLIAAATEAYGATLYKLTDSAGQVTYADAVPKGFRGTVKRLDIDTSERVAVLTPGRGGQVQATAPDYAEIIRRPPPVEENEARVAQARERLEAARQALAAALERSTPDDWIHVGPRNPLGMKRVPRPEYQARLENLERDVQVAEEQLRVAERG